MKVSAIQELTTDDHVISMMIIDKDPLVRRGLASLLDSSSKTQIIAHVSNPPQVLRTIAEKRPTVVLMTIAFLRDVGVSFLSQIRKINPDVKSIITGMHMPKKTLLSAVEAGAFAYISADASPADFEYVIQQATSCPSPVLPSIATELLFDALARTDHSRGHGELTKREREVLRHIAQGMSNKEIATALFLSVGTVKAHVSSILRKLGVADRTQAIVRAMKEGLIETSYGG